LVDYAGGGSGVSGGDAPRVDTHGGKFTTITNPQTGEQINRSLTSEEMSSLNQRQQIAVAQAGQAPGQEEAPVTPEEQIATRRLTEQITVDKTKSYAEQVSEYQSKQLGTYGKLNMPGLTTVQILNRMAGSQRGHETAGERGVYEYIASGKGNYGASVAAGVRAYFGEKGYGEEVGMEALSKNWDIMAQQTGEKEARLTPEAAKRVESYRTMQKQIETQPDMTYSIPSPFVPVSTDLMAQATELPQIKATYVGVGGGKKQSVDLSKEKYYSIEGMTGAYTAEQLRKAQLVSTDESGTQQWIIPTEQELFSQKTEEGFEKFNIFKPLTQIGKGVSEGGDIAYETLKKAKIPILPNIARGGLKAVGGLWQMPEFMEKFTYKTIKGAKLEGAKGAWEATGELTYNPLKWGEKAEFALNVATLVYPSAKETGLAVRELVATKIIGKVAPKLLDKKLIAKLMGTEEVVYAEKQVAGTVAKQTITKKIVTYPLKHPVKTLVVGGFTGLAVYDVATAEDKGKAFESVMTDLTRYYLQARIGGAAGKGIAKIGESKLITTKVTPIKDLGKGAEIATFKKGKLESGREFYSESGKIKYQIKNIYKNLYGKITTQKFTAETPQGGWEANLERGKAEFSLRKETYEQMGKKATPKLKEMKVGRATQVFDLRAKETKFPDIFEIYSKGKVGIKEPYAPIETAEYYDVFGRYKIKGKVIAERVEQGLVQTKGAKGETIIEAKPVKLIQVQKFVGVRDIKMLKALEKGEVGESLLKDFKVPKKVYVPKGTKVETLKTAFGGKSVIVENIPKGVGMRTTAYMDFPYEIGMAKAKRPPIRDVIRKMTKLQPIGKKGQLLITLEKPRQEKPMTMADLERKFMVKEPRLKTEYQKSADIVARQSTKDMLKLLGKFERPKLKYKPPRTIPITKLNQIEKQLLQPRQVQQPKQVTSPLTKQIEKQLLIPKQTTTQIQKQITKTPTVPIPHIPRVPIPKTPPPPPPIFPMDFGRAGYGGRRKGSVGRGQPSPTYIQDFTSKAVGMKNIKMTKSQVRDLLGKTFTGLELRQGITIVPEYKQRRKRR